MSRPDRAGAMDMEGIQTLIDNIQMQHTMEHPIEDTTIKPAF